MNADLQRVQLFVTHVAALLNIIVHSLAVLALWRSSIPYELQLALSLAVIASAIHELANSLKFIPVEIACIEGRWQLRFASGETRPARLQPPVLVQPWLTGMVLVDNAGVRHRIVLSRFNTLEDEFRRLRVLIRFGHPEAAEPA